MRRRGNSRSPINPTSLPEIIKCESRLTIAGDEQDKSTNFNGILRNYLHVSEGQRLRRNYEVRWMQRQ